MNRKYNADVIVTGAGTAGCYFAWLMGKLGYRVIIFEKRRLKDLGNHIDVFHMEEQAFREFDLALPSGKELLHYEKSFFSWSPDLSVKQEIRFPFYVMHKPAFQQRMHGHVRKSGGKIFERAAVNGLIIEKGFVRGVRGKIGNDTFEARGMITVDASGINGALRTMLPDGFGVDNDPVKDSDRFFVCLEYRGGNRGKHPEGSNSYIFHKAFWNRGHGRDSILGIGQPGSYSFAWDKHREWREEYFGNPGRALKRTQGTVPYRRPPFSLAGNGFMVMGDAAFQNKYFSGEGVTSGFTACRIAAETAGKALADNDCGREALWSYNVRYFRGQGALFAGGLAQLPAAAELSRADVNFLFKKGILFNAADFEELNRTYEIRMGTAKTIKVTAALIKGVLLGRFSFGGLRRLMSSSALGAKIKAHYRQYPETPEKFDQWKQKASGLWGEGRQV